MNQNISRRLEQWLAGVLRTLHRKLYESVLRTLHRKLYERTLYCFNTEKRVEEKIKKWLTAEELANHADFRHIIERTLFKNRNILAATSHRIVLFQYSLSGTLTDTSDKIWRQLVSVHLEERIFYSSLKLHFFKFHESIFYPNPNQLNDNPAIIFWRLDELDKKKAREFYTFLKNKEIAMKELRRQEHLDNKIVGGPKLPGGPPPGGGR